MKKEIFTLCDGVELTVEIHPNGMRKTIIPAEHRKAYTKTVMAQAIAASKILHSNS